VSCERIGLVKTSLIDYPGEVAAVLFLPGCNLRCPYCHNPELVTPPYPEDLLPREEVIGFLEKRKKLLGGVCITGGEPLLHRGLPDLVDEIRSLGFKVKLDTNGSFPDLLDTDRYDYIAMDVKTSPGKYGLVKNRGDDQTRGALAEAVLESAGKIIRSGVHHEFRTTVVPGIVTREDILGIAELLRGAEKYLLAGFRPGKTLDPIYAEYLPYSDEELSTLCTAVCETGLPCTVRLNSR
jgi:pyruvate formate lyase activating enzyme